MWRYSKGKCALEVQSINSKSNQEVDFYFKCCIIRINNISDKINVAIEIGAFT